jgi:hypothetical protein
LFSFSFSSSCSKKKKKSGAKCVCFLNRLAGSEHTNNAAESCNLDDLDK